MERESFEDPATAELMNAHFVCVKVDREERPDVDALYMEALQSMSGRGGWPLNVFLTPEQLPFYGGTYFPPEPAHRHARLDARAAARSPGVARATASRSRQGGERLREHLASIAAPRPARSRCRRTCWTRPSRALGEGFDAAPRRLRAARRSSPGLAARVPAAARGERDDRRSPPCGRWPRGGIHDQLGGGFHRYSVDDDLDRAPLREDALRQRAAGPRLPARLAGHRRRGAAAGVPWTRSSGPCARCAGRREASTARWTPTRRASRGASTCGARANCSSCWASTTRRRRPPGWGSARRATSAIPTTPNRG